MSGKRIQLALDLRRWGFPNLAVEIPWLRLTPIERLRAELAELRRKPRRPAPARPRRVNARPVDPRQRELDLE